MDWVALLLKLAHITTAFALVAGLAGRWILLRRAAAQTDIERQHLFAEAASPFERAVQVSSGLVIVLGLATAWAQGYPWLGLTTPWILVTVLLLVPLITFIPAVFIPRGRVFEAAMADARARGIITPALRAAWADRAVALARSYEVAAVAIIVALMVLKPF
jgi:Predicted integral membrane protein (DUF2269)